MGPPRSRAGKKNDNTSKCPSERRRREWGSFVKNRDLLITFTFWKVIPSDIQVNFRVLNIDFYVFHLSFVIHVRAGNVWIFFCNSSQISTKCWTPRTASLHTGSTGSYLLGADFFHCSLEHTKYKTTFQQQRRWCRRTRHKSFLPQYALVTCSEFRWKIRPNGLQMTTTTPLRFLGRFV